MTAARSCIVSSTECSWRWRRNAERRPNANGTACWSRCRHLAAPRSRRHWARWRGWRRCPSRCANRRSPPGVTVSNSLAAAPTARQSRPLSQRQCECQSRRYQRHPDQLCYSRSSVHASTGQTSHGSSHLLRPGLLGTPKPNGRSLARPAVHRHDPHAVHGCGAEGELGASGHSDGAGPSRLYTVAGLSALRPGGARLAQS